MMYFDVFNIFNIDGLDMRIDIYTSDIPKYSHRIFLHYMNNYTCKNL